MPSTQDLPHTSDGLFERALDILPAGVSSPVRAFGAVGGRPLFITSGSGSRLVDVDGREYIDLVMSWGPLLHGHAHPQIVGAIEESSRRGTTFGAPTAVEVELALTIRALMPSLEMLRFTSSGTEATMSALRLARAFTGRRIIAKFDGCYHGHVDALLVKAGSGALTHGSPTSSGVPQEVAEATRSLRYNDLRQVEELMRAEAGGVAAIIVEPVAGNMGTVPPAPGFLQGLRRLTREHGALLIFDEVITGFRLGPGGAQGRYGIRPDMTCLGKIIGGGLPAAAFGGRRDIMQLLSPLGPVYQAGTLSGNPVAMAAGAASLRLAGGARYAQLEQLATALQGGLLDEASAAGVELTVNREGSMLSVFFGAGPVTDLDSAQACDTVRYAAFFRAMLESGIYLPPSQFETWMLSFAHTSADVEAVVSAAGAAFRSTAKAPG